MNGIHNQNFDKPYNGCLGRMVNLFDFNYGIAGNRMLTDKPHCNGYPEAKRSLQDVSRLNHFGDHMESKMTVVQSNATPIKILIAQEMSKELSRSNPPSVVAKLMGLDALPEGRQPNLCIQRSHSDLPLKNQDKGFWDLQMEPELYKYPLLNEDEDHGKSPYQARFDEKSNDEMMNLVRKKFMEAKRLSTDKKRRQSLEIDDALEVLNTNKDLFLKFLQEPNSMLSQKETKKITVLKPRKVFDDSKVVNEVISPLKDHLSTGLKPDQNCGQPTQIVALKPSCSSKPQCIEDESSLNDVESMSQASRHSWDYTNRFDTSYSLETSVCREAKKRISERFATMTSIVSHKDQTYVQRISNTLGEMLALSDPNNTVDSMDSTLVAGDGDSNKDIDIEKSHRRSKSAPVFGTNVDIYDDGSKANSLHETFKERNVKSSLKGKVSSFFFSGRKSNKEKANASRFEDEARQFETLFEPCESAYNSSSSSTQYLNDSSYVTCSSGKVTSPQLSTKPCVVTSEVEKFVTCGNGSENHDQPSPISVLEILFEQERYTTESSINKNPDLGTRSKCSLIDKSTAMKSIASALFFDDFPLDTAVLYPSQTSLLSQAADEEEEERECFYLVETLLSMTGLNGEIQPDMCMAKWYTFESPIDPSLRDKYFDLNEKTTIHEAKRRQRRSTGKLVFDFVNSILVEMAGYGSETCRRAIPCSTRPHNGSITIVNEVCSQMNNWFSKEEERFFMDDFGDGNCVMVEMIVMKEVLGKGWMEHLILEMDNIGLGIELDLFEDLLLETFVQFTVNS